MPPAAQITFDPDGPADLTIVRIHRCDCEGHQQCLAIAPPPNRPHVANTLPRANPSKNLVAFIAPSLCRKQLDRTAHDPGSRIAIETFRRWIPSVDHTPRIRRNDRIIDCIEDREESACRYVDARVGP